MVLEDAAAEADAVQSVAFADAAADLDDRRGQGVVKACEMLPCRPVSGGISLTIVSDGCTKIAPSIGSAVEIEGVALA